jgi:hypothetical protein
MATMTKPSPAPRLLAIVLAPLTLVERTRGRKRSLLLAVYGLALVIAVFFCWRATSLSLLPDAGDPPGLQQLRYIDIKDGQNAFTDYRQASDRLKPIPAAFARTLSFDWATAKPPIREWRDQNKEALALFLRGSNKPSALYYQPHDLTFDTRLNVAQDLRTLCRLALLEASRLEAEGNLDEAWIWYRATLRASRHAGSHGVLIQSLIGTAMLGVSAPKVIAWAEDSRVGSAALRRALGDVRTCEAMTSPFSELVKIEYLTLSKAITNPGKYLDDSRTADTVWYHHAPLWIWGKAFVNREPERSRRVIRLIFANWLAHVDQPASMRPALTRTEPPLFTNTTRELAGLSPEAVERWFRSTTLAYEFLPAVMNAQKAVDRDRRHWGSIEVALAEQLHRREHGVPPRALGELVGPFLERLPEGYSPTDQATTTTRVLRP